MGVVVIVVVVGVEVVEMGCDDVWHSCLYLVFFFRVDYMLYMLVSDVNIYNVHHADIYQVDNNDREHGEKKGDGKVDSEMLDEEVVVYVVVYMHVVVVVVVVFV